MLDQTKIIIIIISKQVLVSMFPDLRAPILSLNTKYLLFFLLYATQLFVFFSTYLTFTCTIRYFIAQIRFADEPNTTRKRQYHWKNGGPFLRDYFLQKP